MEIDNAAAVIIGLFAILALILAHARLLMRDIARTVETWRELRDALRGSAEDERASQHTCLNMTTGTPNWANDIDRRNSFEEPGIDAAPPTDQAENL